MSAGSFTGCEGPFFMPIEKCLRSYFFNRIVIKLSLFMAMITPSNLDVGQKSWLFSGWSMLADHYRGNGKVVNRNLTILTRKRQGLRLSLCKSSYLMVRAFFWPNNAQVRLNIPFNYFPKLGDFTCSYVIYGSHRCQRVMPEWRRLSCMLINHNLLIFLKIL